MGNSLNIIYKEIYRFVVIEIKRTDKWHKQERKHRKFSQRVRKQKHVPIPSRHHRKTKDKTNNNTSPISCD